MKRLIKGRVNIGQESYTPLAYVNQLDNITLELNIYSGDTPLNVTGQTVSLYAKRSNKTVVEQLEGFSIETSKVTGDVKNSCFAVPGITEMQLEFTDSNGKTTVSSFYVHVNKSLSSEDSITANNEIGILTEAKEQEPIRQRNETERIKNETARGQDETNRAAAEEIREQQELARQTCYKEIEESRMDFDGGIHKNLKLRLMRDFGDIYNRFNESNLLPYEAEYISASNSYKGMTKDNVVKGKTIQNLCPQLDSIASNWTINNAGTIPIAYYTKFKIDKILFKPNTVYTAVFITPNDNVKGFSFHPWQDLYADGKINKFTTNDLTKSPTFIHVKGTQGVPLTVDDILGIKVMVIEGDWTNKPIPPYFEGIKSVNEDGENMEMVSCGKNLFNPNYLKTVEGTTYEVLTKDGRECLKPTSNFHNTWYQKILFNKFKPNTQYTISYDVFYEGDKVGLYPAIKYTDGTSFVLATNDFNAWNTKQFTTPIGKSVESIFFVYSYGTPTYFDLNSFKLNEGTSIAEEPYQEHRLPIKMKNLRSLPNGICDTSDGVRRIEKIIIDGSQDIKLESINANGIANFYIILTQLGTSVAICDKLLIDNSFIANAIREGFIIVNSNTLYIRILSSKVSTVTAAKLYFKNNPHTFYYELATSTTEEGNTEELRTYDGQTNIFTEGSLIEPTISCKVPSNVQQVVMNLRSENEALNNDVNTLQATTEENNLMNIETNVNQEARLTMLELGVI